MKKIKISELPLCSTLRGMFTIGVDAQNRSVKVSLQFVEDTTKAAVSKALDAAASALNAMNKTIQATKEALQARDATVEAINRADAATKTANASASKADTATANADAATSSANTATANANEATRLSKEATETCNTSTAEAVKNAETAIQTASDKCTETTAAATKACQDAIAVSKKQCDEATAAADLATKGANEATAAAQKTTADTVETMNNIIPLGLSVEQLPRLTLGNVSRIKIQAVLKPATALKNLIYLSDNKAVSVSADGFVTPVSKGVSYVHVVPTMNTSLAKTVLIEVGDPTLRLNSMTQLRFTQGGGLRLN